MHPVKATLARFVMHGLAMMYRLLHLPQPHTQYKKAVSVRVGLVQTTADMQVYSWCTLMWSTRTCTDLEPTSRRCLAVRPTASAELSMPACRKN